MAEESNPSYSFTDFPEDVQLCILSFLSPSEIIIFACTSKRFVSLCQNDSKLWYNICHRRWGPYTQVQKWGSGKISYKLLYKTLIKWENLIGFWRRCGQASQKHSQASKPPALIFFEWGPAFLSGFRVSPSEDGSYNVIKTPFIWMGISADGEIVNYLDFDGQNGNVGESDVVSVSVNFIGEKHFSVEENVGSRADEMNGEDLVNGVECGSSPPEMEELYQYYANRMSPGADRTWRRQRRRGKERQGRKRWETEHFSKIVDCSPSPARPLQGLWKGLCDDMKLEFYLVEYDGSGISCRRVGDLSDRISSCTPVFWTSNPTFVESPFSPEEEYVYDSRVHIRPSAPENSLHWQHPLIDNEVVSRIMYINSSYDLVIPGLVEVSENPWRVEGRIWQYRDGTFGFGFLGDNFIVDLKHIAQNGRLLDTT